MSAINTPTAASMLAARGPLAAGATAVAFAAEAVVAALHPADIADHAQGAGRVSEALAGLGFLLAAVALLAYAPGMRRLAGLLVPGVLGCAAVGIAQLDVAARGQEWSEGVVTVIVLTAWAGLLLAGIAGVRARLWPWWAALALTAVVPALFFVPSPFNSAVIALLWLAVAAVTRRSGRAR